MKTLMTTLLLAGTALMAQTGKTPAPAPAAAASSSTAAPAPAKVKKHHRKAKKTTPDAATTNVAPAKK